VKKVIIALLLGLIVTSSFVGITQNDKNAATQVKIISDPGGGSGGSGS